MKNIMKTYFNFKINILVSLTLVCFDDEKENKEFLTECLERLYRCYIKDIYYHEATSLDQLDVLDEETIKAELEGVTLELKQDLADKEIQMSNEEYAHKLELIDKCFEKALVICDFNDFYYDEDSKEKYNTMIKRVGINDVEAKINTRYSTRAKLHTYNDSPKSNNWDEVSAAAEEATYLEMKFLAGFFDILENLLKTIPS